MPKPTLVLDQLRQDIVFAVRGLWRARGFTAGAVAVLALGIGANLALFQMFDVLVIHRYSIPNADSFVRVRRTSRDGRSTTFPTAAVEFFRANSSAFAALVSQDKSFTVSVDGVTGRRSTFVSANYFANVVIRPVLGRVFDAEDSRAVAAPVALLDHQYWRTQFAGDRNILGRIVKVNGVNVQVVGVLPEDFAGFSVQRTDLWLPESARPLLIPGNPAGQSELFGRLKPGVAGGYSVQPALAELMALTKELARQQPRYFNEDDRIEADFVQESLLGFLLSRSPAIVVFSLMVLLILLSACAHVGNMLLVRGLGRQQELAIRISIGASRNRLIRQLVTENALLAILGSAAGLAVGVLTARLALLAVDSTYPFQILIHWQIVVACLAMTFISVLVFAIPSAREVTRTGFHSITMRSRFVANQVSISCVLLIVSAVFASKNLLAPPLNLQFNYRNTMVVDPQLRATEGTVDALQQRLDSLSARFNTVPGVESVTVGTAVPLRGRVTDNFPLYPRILRSSVAPSFFAVMGLSILHGRTFLPGEQNVVIASDSAARALWPGQEPLGQLWTVAGARRTVVGVVADSRVDETAADSIEAYLPISPRDVEACVLILRTRPDAASMAGTIERFAADLDQTVTVTPMTVLLDAAQNGNWTLTALFGCIGFIATVLAAAGMFALMAFTVVQRTREIGIRIAIGATPLNLLSGLLRLHAQPLAGGVVKGAFAGVMLLLFVRAVIYPERAVVLMAGLMLGLVLFLVVAALSIAIPALRALRIDPSAALHTE